MNFCCDYEGVLKGAVISQPTFAQIPVSFQFLLLNISDSNPISPLKKYANPSSLFTPQASPVRLMDIFIGVSNYSVL